MRGDPAGLRAVRFLIRRSIAIRQIFVPSFIVVAVCFGAASSGCRRKTGDSSSSGASSASPARSEGAIDASASGSTASRTTEAGAGDVADFTRTFRGTIGGKLAIVMRLERTNDALDGTYFYEPSATDLRLHGAITPSGAIHLDESSGKVTTGTFDGTLDASGAFSGTWSDPKRSRVLPFRLVRVSVAAGAPVLTVMRSAVFELRPKRKPPANSWPSGEPTCKSDVHFAEVIGGIDPSREAAVNARLRADEASTACDEPFEHEAATHVFTNERGVLSVVLSSSHYESGMPHPAYGQTFVNVAVPSGVEIELSDVLLPSASDVIAARLRPELERIDDPSLRTMIDDALAFDRVDFAIEPSGIRLSTFNRLPHAYKGMDGDYGFFVPASALAKARVKPSAVDHLWP